MLCVYDLCISSMAIHHLDMAGKEALFRLIAGHLEAGGCFINIDVVLTPSEGLETWYFALWKDWLPHMMELSGVTEGNPEDLIRRYKDPAGPNRPGTLGRQLVAPESAGFSEVDCHLKNGIFAVFGMDCPRTRQQ